MGSLRKQVLVPGVLPHFVDGAVDRLRAAVGGIVEPAPLGDLQIARRARRRTPQGLSPDAFLRSPSRYHGLGRELACETGIDVCFPLGTGVLGTVNGIPANVTAPRGSAGEQGR